MLRESKAFKVAMCAKPLAPPPDKTKPILGKFSDRRNVKRNRKAIYFFLLINKF